MKSQFFISTLLLVAWVVLSLALLTVFVVPVAFPLMSVPMVGLLLLLLMPMSFLFTLGASLLSTPFIPLPCLLLLGGLLLILVLMSIWLSMGAWFDVFFSPLLVPCLWFLSTCSLLLCRLLSCSLLLFLIWPLALIGSFPLLFLSPAPIVFLRCALAPSLCFLFRDLVSVLFPALLDCGLFGGYSLGSDIGLFDSFDFLFHVDLVLFVFI